MGYYFQGLLSEKSSLDLFHKDYPLSKIIHLFHNLYIIPFEEDFINSYINDNSEIIKPFQNLSEKIESSILAISNNIKIAYLEAEYFGGLGTKHAILYDKSSRKLIINNDHEAFNVILREFNIKTSYKDKDEFATVNFGRYRFTEDWLGDKNELPATSANKA